MNKQATEHDVHVGNRIRFYRHELGISQQALGELLNVSFQQIQKYEKGVNRLAGARLVQLASVFHCDVADLMPAVKRNGKQKPQSNYERVITMDDGRRLIEAFIRIEDERLRRALVKVAQQFSQQAS